MLEFLIAGAGNTTVSSLPNFGYNFSLGKSTGQSNISQTNATTLSPVPSTIGSYTKNVYLTSPSVITPASVVGVSTGDFTYEILVYVNNSASAYSYFHQFIPNDPARGFILRIGDSGLGNRLQVGYLSSSPASTMYSAPITRTDMYQKWYHLAVVRASGRTMLFVNGVQQTLALWTSTTYNTPSFTDTNNLSATTSIQMSNSSYPANSYIPEYAFWPYAKYTSNFTPSYPLVPQSISVSKLVSSGASGNESLAALGADNFIYTRGSATNGKLANGSTSAGVYSGWWSTLATATNIWGGGSTFLIRKFDGTLSYSGSQTPFGLTGNVSAFTALPTAISSAIDLSKLQDVNMSNQNAMWLLNDGTLYMTGTNESGAAGVDTANITTPIQVATNVRSIAMATSTAYYVTNDNKLFCAGDNTYNQLGDGTTTTRKSFAELSITAGVSGVVQGIAAGLTGAHILGADGYIYAVGAYIYGNGGSRYTTPTLVTLPASPNYYNVTKASLSNTAANATNGDRTTYYARSSFGNYVGLPNSSSGDYVTFATEFDHTKTNQFIMMYNSSWILNSGKLYHAGARTITDSATSTTVDSSYTNYNLP